MRSEQFVIFTLEILTTFFCRSIQPEYATSLWKNLQFNKNFPLSVFAVFQQGLCNQFCKRIYCKNLRYNTLKKTHQREHSHAKSNEPLVNHRFNAYAA